MQIRGAREEEELGGRAGIVASLKVPLVLSAFSSRIGATHGEKRIIY